MTYIPKPIKTDHVDVPKDILALIEPLAEHAHEIWAQRRIAEGWRFGPSKVPEIKETPLLVPYLDLPESEKDMDREAALQTIKALMALGCKIAKR
jgi:RyR domain